MNFKKKILPLALLLLLVAAMTSCNRGYGCPNNFSMNQSDVSVVE